MPISSLLWGTNFENAVTIGYPIYSVLSDREERDGSVHIQGPSGQEDSWIVGRDYVMDAEVRWIPDGPGTNPAQTQLSGPVSWQEFLDWARDANSFRFVPDATVPDFYVDNVYLVEPRKGFGSLSADIKRNVKIKLRNATKDFHEAMRGIMFEYAPGTSLVDPLAYTFTRASAANRRGQPSTTMASAIGASELSNVLRDRHYEGSLKTALVESFRAQLVTDPENFGNWGTNGIVGLTAGQADPFGGTAAYLFDSNTPQLSDYKTQLVTFTADATKAFMVFMKAGTASLSAFAIYNGTVLRHRVKVTWTAGVPALSTDTGAGTLFPVVPWGGGWYLLAASANGVLAADANQFLIYADFSGAGGTTNIFGANAWNQIVPASYQGPSIASRLADSLSSGFTYRPQAIFVLVDLIEAGAFLAPASTFPAALAIGNFNAPNWRTMLYYTGGNGKYTIANGNNVSQAVQQHSINPAFGDRVQLLGLIYSDGSVKLGQTINLGAEVQTTQSGAPATPIPTSYGTLTAALGGGGTAHDVHKIIRAKVGILTLGGQNRDTIAKALAA